jgi:succinate dehydrogenase/fumarate reductase flavoprotein subunit
MSSENKIDTDVLVIGGSVAGLFAAIKARDTGVNVTVVDKGYIGRSGSALFANFYQVFNPEWGHNMKDWMAQIAQAGDYVNNPEWTEITLKESYERYQDLKEWGDPFEKKEDGSPIRSRSRGVLEALRFSPGRVFLPSMRNRATNIGVRVMDRVMITDLIKQEGKVIGAVGFHTISGDFYVFQAKAIVMCTGGGALGGNEHIGSRFAYNGEIMAYQAGASISGKEFSLTGVGANVEPALAQKIMAKPDFKGKKIKAVSSGFHPYNIIHYFDAEGNSVGRNTAATSVHKGLGPIIWDLGGAKPEELSLAKWATYQTVINPKEFEVDIFKGGLYSGTQRYESYIGHPVEGGGAGIYSTDTGGSTTVPGLYAAGDCYHARSVGAMYPGWGMGTRNASVTGARAGRSAAEFAKKTGKIVANPAEVARLKKEVYLPLERPGGFDTDWVTLQLKSIMVPYYVWIIRHGDRLKAALTFVDFLKNHVELMIRAKPKDAHGLRIVHETKSRISSVEMMLRSALFRTESRGVHYREDYPQRHDPDWLAVVKLRNREGIMELSKESIPQKYWPDLSIPYRERYPNEFLGEESLRQ